MNKCKNEETDKAKDIKVISMLPPCRVCNEKASGLHYGVNTCEACKAFFRRSLQRGFGSSYRCVGSSECTIFENKRNSCSFCRFNKCLKLGMSKEAIKTGRYTHEKRAEDIMEVKRLAANHNVLPKDFNLPQSITPPVLNNHSINSLTNYNLNDKYLPALENQQTSFLSKTTINNNVDCVVNANTCQLPKVERVNSIDSSVQNEYETKLQEIILSITKTFLKDTIFTEEFMQKLPERQKQYLEQRELQTAVFGPLNPLTKDEYHRIYRTTGIDVDGRKERIVEELPHIEMAIKRFICFAKSVPGFNQLNTEDQISLIKAAKFEAWMVTCHRLFNSEHKLYTEQSGQIVSIEQMKMVNNSHFVDEMFLLTSKLQKLNMDIEETSVLAAICLMSSDICDLQNKDIVSCSQDLLLKCILYMFNKREPHNRIKFGHVVNCLLHMRSLKELHTKEEEIFVMEWSDTVEIPMLVYEIWST